MILKRWIRTRWWISFVAFFAMTAQGLAWQFQINKSVIALDANATNDTIAKTVTPSSRGSGTISIPLAVIMPAQMKTGRLSITNFDPQTDSIRTATAQIKGADALGNFDIDLTKSQTNSLEIELTGLRRGITYKGRLLLGVEGTAPHHWDIAVTTARGAIILDPVPALRLVTMPLGWTCVFSACNAGTTVPIILRDKNDGSPYTHIKARYIPNSNANAKAILPPVSIDSFTFCCDANGKPLDLTAGAGNFQIDGTGKIQMGFLLTTPGEYTGTIQFAANETADDAADAKQTVTVQVRHHWIFPVLVIIFGSLVGFLTSKYVTAARKAGQLKEKVDDMRDRADALARRATLRDGWNFSSEATSYGLARARVTLHQLLTLCSEPLTVLSQSDEIENMRQSADRRLSALESFRTTRLNVQRSADRRPAIQQALGRDLRTAMDLIEKPQFLDTDLSALTQLLATIDTSVKTETFVSTYIAAVLNRRRTEIPSDSDITGLAGQTALQNQLKTLKAALPTEDEIKAATTTDQLAAFDDNIAKIVLLWREREFPWADTLVKQCVAGRSAQDLFKIVDTELWDLLEQTANAEKLKFVREYDYVEQPKIYDFVELHLRSTSEVSNERILYHPLRVRWDIEAPDGQKRVVETDSLKLVQYFPDPGTVTFSATLIWQDKEIPVKYRQTLTIVDTDPTAALRPASWTEWAVIVVAVGFAAATGLNTMYDSTFGSYAQYVALFLWAAGAASGGNIFKEFGTTNTAGGHEATLTKS